MRLNGCRLLADDTPDGGIGGFVKRERRDAEDGGEMACAGVVADIERRAFQQIGKLLDIGWRFDALAAKFLFFAAFEFYRAEDKPNIMITELPQRVGNSAIEWRRVVFGAAAAAGMNQRVGSD